MARGGYIGKPRSDGRSDTKPRLVFVSPRFKTNQAQLYATLRAQIAEPFSVWREISSAVFHRACQQDDGRPHRSRRPHQQIALVHNDEGSTAPGLPTKKKQKDINEIFQKLIRKERAMSRQKSKDLVRLQ